MLNKVFEPIKIGTMEVKNRLVVPPMVVNFANEDGTANERFIAYIEEKAKGGWGLIIPENYTMDPEAKGFLKLPGLWNDDQIESHKELTDKAHKHGAKIVVQINHAGRQTASAITGVQPVAPSPIPDPTIGETPKELSVEEIHEIVEKFGDAALRGKKAGFDGIEVHGSHGYLINQFMSPFSNKRTDEYGGNIQNRARFALEVIENMKKKIGEDFPLIYRMSVNELVEGGLTTEESKVIAMMLEESGVHAIHATNGVYASAQYIIPPAAVKHGWSSDISAEIKKVVSIPVITVGRVNDPLIAESILVAGKADLVSMGRASLADPYLPNKAKEGRLDEITRCIGCLQGCAGRNVLQLPVQCLVNPMTGNESEFKFEEAEDKKKVLIAGGGIAGMEVAIVAAKRGHEVHLYEKNNKLGGQWILAAVPPSKEELNTFTVWQKNQIEKLGVNVYLNTGLTEEIVEDMKPDTVIVATGAKPFVPNIPGKDQENVVIANDVLAGLKDVGANVVVIGGGAVGAETAAHLANHNKKVTIVEMMPEIAKGGEPAVNHFLFKDLEKNKVQILTNTSVKEILNNEVVIADKEGKQSKLENIDTVVMAIGSRTVNELAAKLEGKVEKVITIGDAVKVRKGFEAIDEGFRVGFEI
ncbi:FAD-dependent oxidoreductase [Oceanirhabdus seepicola]|uniref:FAD-dependent oxidoreductase n=1 Tax=Oceanirhabdus seepicola TaxID=2828781 RepID=A0A9J6P4U0_9CLOT|nr:FAD-dependent oxidoreductase [Oceanirhabdus seepicola]MCM1991794.1 FAD-dependent oxidoreductase [Oceanirhabdus seepicola]